MAHDQDFFRRRAAEARSAASHREDGDGAEVAGHLALAYAALARRRSASLTQAAADAIEVSATDPAPILLRD